MTFDAITGARMTTCFKAPIVPAAFLQERMPPPAAAAPSPQAAPT